MGGTSIVILITPDKIVVGADSKAVSSQVDKMCKIFKTGSIYWALSGIIGTPETGYSVASIIKKSYIPGQSVEKLFPVFKRNVIEPLRQDLIYLQRERPRDFAGIRYHPLEIAFWQFEGGKPVIARVFYTTEIVNRRITLKSEEDTVSDCRLTDCTPGIAVLLGAREAITNYVKSHRDWALNLNASAYKFVTMAIGEQPTTVGPPINILTIRQDGSFQWNKPNEYCYDTPKEHPPRIPIATHH